LKYTSLSESKRLIFEKSIELFASKPFETVTMNDLSAAVGKTKSSFYNHFVSKQQILDEIYDFFCDHFSDNRNTPKQIDPILQQGSLLDIIHSVFFIFGESEPLMLPILQIIHQRKFFDGRARQIVQDILISDSITYAQTVFDRAVKIGRLAPFDTQLLAILCNNSRLIIYDKWILNPTAKYYRALVDEEDRIYTLVSQTITDLRPPAI